MGKCDKLNKMSGFKRYWVWGERKFGQSKPSVLKDARTLDQAKRIGNNLKIRDKYVIKIKEVYVCAGG